MLNKFLIAIARFNNITYLLKKCKHSMIIAIIFIYSSHFFMRLR